MRSITGVRVCPVVYACFFFFFSHLFSIPTPSSSDSVHLNNRCRNQNKESVSGVASLSHAGSATATDETAAVQMPKRRAPHMILRPMQGDLASEPMLELDGALRQNMRSTISVLSLCYCCY
ncbi:hypothetical protein ACQKWADRAFT_277108 [Trichoderma austrokoningii]